MSDFTHVFLEAGNGFPGVGDDVLIGADCGRIEIKKVASISRINTRQWKPNWIYLTLTDADRDYDELSDDEAEEAWEELHHVNEITADTPQP